MRSALPSCASAAGSRIAWTRMRAQLPQPWLWFRRCGRRSGVLVPAYGWEYGLRRPPRSPGAGPCASASSADIPHAAHVEPWPAPPVADHLLEPLDGRLGPSPVRVAGGFLPRRPSVLGDAAHIRARSVQVETPNVLQPFVFAGVCPAQMELFGPDIL